jgi:large subunit ribosomal protein L13
MTRTIIPKPSEVPARWLLVDAQDRVLGRLASRVAKLLMGKTKPLYARHLIIGDHVVVINAEKIRVTGKKPEQKRYYHYTGYPGGLKSKPLAQLRAEKPERLFRDAVWGMLPKNRLGRKMISRLHVYRGSEHLQKAQKPQLLELA